MFERNAPATPDETMGEINLRELWATLVRHRWLIVLVTMAMVGLAVGYTATQRPIYQAEATLRIDENDAGRSILGNLAPLARVPGKVETEMMVLESRQIAEAVVDSLDLMLQLHEPAVPRSEVFRSAVVPLDALAAELELQREANGAYAVTVKYAGTGVTAPRRVRPGEPFRVGSAVLELAPRPAGEQPERIAFGIVPFRQATEGVRSSLDVERPEPTAQVVAVRYLSADKELAAAVPNAVMHNFIHYKAEGSKAQSRGTVNFLRDQVATYQNELRRAENELRGFRERERVVSLTDEATEQVQRLANLQAENERLRTEREALARLLGRLEGQPGDGGDTSPYRQLASFPVFLSNRAVQDLLQSLTAIENQRATELVGRTEAHRDVQALDQRKRDLEVQLYEIARNYLEGLNSQIASTETSLNRFAGELQTIPAREVEFARLLRDQTLLAQLYTLLQTRLKEAEILEAVNPTDVRVIDTALVPNFPISPRPMRNLMIGLMLGMMLGVGLAFARQMLDTKVRTKEDVQAAGGVPVIATIPRIELEPVAVNGRRGGRFRPAAATTAFNRLVSQVNPSSPASEAFRALRTSITFSGAGQPPRVLVVTSAMPGEGKSTSSANLAVTLAQQGTRTLLIDGDLRRGVLHRMLDVPQNPGLTHVLVGRATADEAVHLVAARDGEEQAPLYLLPTGVYPPNPAELLGAPQMAKLMAELRGKFDVILIDAPPLNLVTDAALLAKLADTTLLVTRVNLSDKRALHHATAQLHQVNAPMAGVILNGIDVASSYYGYHGYASAAPSGNGSHGIFGRNGDG